MREPFADGPFDGVEPDSSPTPPPSAVRIGSAPELASPPRSSWALSAWAGALFAVPLAVLIAHGAFSTEQPGAREPSMAKVAAATSPVLNALLAPTGLESPPVRPSTPAADLTAAAPRADSKLNRDERHYPVHGGVLFTPKTFASADGAYDLYLHFHGNTRVVLESAELAGVNAFVAVVNLGIGSAPYEDAYAQPGSYAKLLAEIQHGAEARGLEHAHVRRIALGSWSAGYGAIGGILQQPRSHERLDALLVLDGIHVGWLEEDRATLNARNLGPFLEAARAAARSEFLFSITHSEIIPEDYASTTATADLLLDTVNAARHPVSPDLAPPHLSLESAKNAVSKKLEKHMEPLSEALVGSLHVRGYRGNTPEHHMAHLLQMGATVMPELAARWEHDAPAAP